jgi:hypothetical protein
MVATPRIELGTQGKQICLILFLIQRIRAIISYTNSQAIKGTKKDNQHMHI